MFAQVKANHAVAIWLPRPDHSRAGRRFAPFAGLRGALVAGLLLVSSASFAAAQTNRIRFDLTVARGDSAWAARRFPDAKAAYQEALSLDSTGSSRATYRLAVLHSWDGDLARAIPLFRSYTVLEPRDEEGRLALARAHAWAGETSRAVAIYDSIVGRDSTYRDAVLGAAQALSWAGFFTQAIGRYDRWLRYRPQDVEAELARARTLAWAGRLAESERAYTAIAARGERLEADKGVALVAAWRGDLGRSERLWTAITDRAPLDAEAWVGLAQVLRWSGRPDDAHDALRRALAADPRNADAAAQLRWVRADLARAIEPAVSASWDSDDNKSIVLSEAGSFRVARRTRLGFSGTSRHADLGETNGTSYAGRLTLRAGVTPDLTLLADLGATRTKAENPTAELSRTRATGSIGGIARLSSRVSVGASVRRSVFDETAALLLSGIDVTSIAGDVDLALASRWSLGFGAERADLDGGSGPNQRASGFAVLRWRVRRPVSLSVSGRSFGYDVQRRDGYFAPASYSLAELGVRWTPGRDLGWGATAEGGFGAQRVRFGPGAADTKATQRLALGIVYRFKPGSEIGIDYGFSNVSATAAGPAGGSIYRAHALSVRSRLTL